MDKIETDNIHKKKTAQNGEQNLNQPTVDGKNHKKTDCDTSNSSRNKKYSCWHRMWHRITVPRITACCTFAIVVITALYTYYAREQVSQMREAVIATQRPWISVHLEIVSGLTFDEHGGHIIIKIKMKNVGQHPAIGINYFAIIYPLGPKEIWTEIQKTIFNIAERQGKIHFIGNALFKGEEHSTNIGLDFDWDTIKRGVVGIGNTIWPNIVGCVYYRFISGGAIHKTGFAEAIMRIDTKTNRLALIDATAGNIPEGMLRLQALPLGHYAD